MVFHYDRITRQDVPANLSDEFYTYVDTILDLLIMERINPYTHMLYCPYDDPTFSMSPVHIRYSHKKEIRYTFEAFYTLPKQDRIDEPITRVHICLKVSLRIFFKSNDDFSFHNFIVELCPQMSNTGSLPYEMETRYFKTLDQIRDGLRIFLASAHDFYSCPPDEDSRLARRGHITSDYIDRNSKYINHIQSDGDPNRKRKADEFMGLTHLEKRYNSDVMTLVRDKYLNNHNDFMRRITSQGVAPESI
jgi:hypothetical protein